MSIAVGHEPPPPVPMLSEAPSPVPAEGARGGQPSAFPAILQSLAAVIDQGESLTRSALRSSGAGQAIGPAALIALQAGIYRYAEAVDLASRLVDRATGAVKSVVQGS